MNKKGFAISVVLYSVVFLLISILYMITGVLKTRYHVKSDLRDTIVEQLNESINRRTRCVRMTGEDGTLVVGDAFKCDVNGDGIFDEGHEKFYYISNFYNQSSNSFDPSVTVLIHSLNSNSGNVVSTNSPVKWNNTLTLDNGPASLKDNFPSSNWLNVVLKANPRKIMIGYNSTNSMLSFQYPNSTRLLTVEEFLYGCNPVSKCNFLFNTMEAETGNGIWLENIASKDNKTVYIIDSTTHELSTDTVTSSNMLRTVIDVSKDSIAY